MSVLAVLGGGYVGLVSAACFARLGHSVTCIETDAARLRVLADGRLPIREPGLEDLWGLGRESGRLRVTGGYEEEVAEAEFVFVAVGTPPLADGSPDLSQIDEAVKSLAGALPAGARPTIVIKSTVPLGTAERVGGILSAHGRAMPVISNPEFLREGQGILDFMRPARVVIGGADAEARARTAALYQPLKRPIIHCSNRAAELIKYASNAFLCTKVSFINELAAICEATGVDVREVAQAVGMDARIGHSYLEAGLGWGGSCLPKDVRALISMAADQGLATPVLDGAVAVNQRQPLLVIEKLRAMIGELDGSTICVLGLSFKPNCDDVRDSPALALIERLMELGVNVRAYDPLAMAAAAAIAPGVTYCADPYEAATEADGIVLATNWSAFDHLDLDKLDSVVRRPVLVDARNALDEVAALAAGFSYTGIGRRGRAPHLAHVVSTEAGAVNGRRSARNAG
jgi:UDPglucose 6-dehydrogenase